MLKLSPKDFYDKYIQLLNRIKTDRDYDSPHDAQIHWYCENILGLDADDVKTRIVRDTAAEGIDGVFVNQAHYELLFIQCKTVNSFENSQKNMSENDIKTTLAGATLLIKGNYQGKITSELENYVDEYHDLDNTCLYQTKILFIVLQQAPVDFKFADDFKRVFPNIQVDFVLFNDLHKSYEDFLIQTAPPPDRITFEVAGGNLQHKESPIASVVFSGYGKDLARIYNEHGERIFEQNVRGSLGIKLRSINSQIFVTACDPEKSPNFWYFNNGVTIVCKKLTPSASGRAITLENAQIINGAQTTHSLYQAWLSSNLQDNVELIVRVIETVDEEVIEAITLYTNSQNAIKLRDLCSNDPIQKEIQSILITSYSKFYQKKRGEFIGNYKTVSARIKAFGDNYKDNILENEDAAQAYMGLYLNMPAEAKNEKARIFSKETNGLYDIIYSRNNTNIAEQLLLSWQLLKAIKIKQISYHSEYKKAIKSGNEELIKNVYHLEFILHAEFFILNLTSDFICPALYNVRGDKTAIDHIINDLNEDSVLFDNIYDRVINAMIPAMKEFSDKPGYYHNKFFKNSASISLLREKIHSCYPFVKTL